uniref:Uncharacterized protein n=1 Tax=Anolis carolinensis TaxID=28377 RepID=G1KF50_ANOCA
MAKIFPIGFSTGYRALKQTLQLVAAFHDIISYIFSFVQLGSPPDCFDYFCSSDHLSADWGGTGWIGNELQELQKKIDYLHNPTDPKKVAQMLSMHRELLLLQFDAAVRHSIEAFLSSGNICAYQNITDNIYHGLPPLSNAVVGSLFASQFQLPQPLDPHGRRADMLFPWRTFQANSSSFPVVIDNLNPIDYCMQLCLCGLNYEERKTAHGELVGMQFIIEDVLLNNYETPNLATIAEASGKPSEAPLELLNSMASCAPQKSYLILWKQRETLKAEWGRLKLKVEDINTIALYKQFSELYSVEVLCPAMRSLARRRGIEVEFEGFGATSQSVYPLKEASQVEIKTYQLQKLLESLEVHMIHDVQKKVNKEITLVISEKARHERNLPTELWKHHSMQEIFSVTRPEIVESFIQRLMENHQESEAEISFQKDHLQKCLTALGCDVMARERSNFENYSMFYENILHRQHQLLYKKEQVFLILSLLMGGGVSEMNHDMIMEITALRAKTADLQEENHSLREKIRKEVQEDYEALVQSMFMTCVHLKGKVDEYRLSLSQRMFEIISEVRRDGVDKMIALKKKFGSTKDNIIIIANCFYFALHSLLDPLHSQVDNKNKKEYLKLKMMAEKEAVLFRQQLRSARKALAQSQAENKKLNGQLDKQVQIWLLEQKMNQEVSRWQQVNLMKTENLEKMLENLAEKEVKLQSLTEEAEKSTKIQQLQGKRVKKEIQSQLTQERSLKLNAYQRVEELQSQLYDVEATTSQRNSPGGIIAGWVRDQAYHYSRYEGTK